MKRIKYLFLAAGILLSVRNSYAQSAVSDSLQIKYNAYAKTFREKVFLHIDRSYYMTGDICWFKAYVVESGSHKAADLSKVVYVELLDASQHAVLQAKLSLADGLGSGSLVLPATLTSGNYKIRAYTSWMKNFSPEYYFEDLVTIVNPNKRPAKITSLETGKPEISFLPEGGNLVENLKSKVAFKVLGPDDKGLDVRGSIIDQKNDTVVRFKSLRYGMGQFYFTPESGKTYKAVLFAGNRKMMADLPEIHSSGFVMSLSDTDPKMITVNVKSRASAVSGDIFLLVHTGQTTSAALSGRMLNGEVTFNLEKLLLAEGISHFTIFNGKNAVCERLYFKPSRSKLLISASTSASKYATRKKVEVNISTVNQDRRQEAANLSVAVYRLDSLNSFKHITIEDYLWLTSELKGQIENAEYYFDPEHADRDQALENLILTQGWRRFDWDDILKSVPPAFPFLPEVQGHIITGKLTLNETGAAAPAGINTFLSAAGKRVQFYPARTSEQGKLLFFTKDLYGSNELIIQNNYTADSIYRVEITSPFSGRYSEQKIPDLRLAASDSGALALRYINTQLHYLYSKGPARFLQTPIDTGAFFGPPDVSYDLDDYTRFTTMEEVLKEYIKEIIVLRKQKKQDIKMVYSYKKGLYDHDPLLLIDGVPFFEADKIIAFDPLKLKTIQIVNQRYLKGELVTDGIMNFQTYKGDLGGFQLDPRALVLDYEGLEQKREFYSPRYQTSEEISSRLPDFRELLFWSPDIQTDASGKSKMSFFTSDQPGNYIMQIQGISADGHAGSTVQGFRVSKE